MPRIRSSSRSFWQRGVRVPMRSPLRGRQQVDVAIVGAGITGLTAALLLAGDGRDVAVLDAAQVGGGTTGASSAHVTDVLDLRHHALLDRFGEDVGRSVIGRGRAALDFIAQVIAADDIRCDVQRLSGYLYCENPAGVAALEREAAAAERLGRPCRLIGEVPLPWPVAGAVEFPGQLAFDPLRYALGLAQVAAERGAAIYERSGVTSVSEPSSGGVEIETAHAVVHAAHLIMATHTPLGLSRLHAQVAPYRSYLVVLDSDPPVPAGLFWDTDEPYHYLRRVERGGTVVTLLGGADHKTGQQRDPERCYRELEDFARARLPGVSVIDRWSAQYYEPVDGLPYVGRLPGSDHISVVTGLSGTGLAYGTAAAIELAAALRGESRDNPFQPARLNVGGLPRLARENVNVAACWLGDRWAGGDVESTAAIAPGEGAIVRLDGERRAVCHAEDGTLHVLSAVCPHMGGMVRWNAVERSWDCPCHGARFAATGELLEGPALSGLTPVGAAETGAVVEDTATPRQRRAR